MLKISYASTREFKMTDNNEIKFSFQSSCPPVGFARKAINKEAN